MPAIQYKRINDLLSEREIKFPELSIFSDRGIAIKVSHWQPEGILSFVQGTGIRCSSEEHSQKAEQFIELSENENVDIALTPEYSLPWSVLEKIFRTKELWPGNGKLLCLGMEGISYKDFSDFKSAWDDRTELVIVTEDLGELFRNQFFSCVAYVFCASKKLICIIQFKTTAASDKWVELESRGLTTGNVIYYFQDTKTNHCLLTYICADALNQGISSVKEQVNYQKCIILHPQLNPKPLHDSFCQMRKDFLNYSQGNIRIISVNWSKNTVIKRENGEKDITITDSYSACYYGKTMGAEALTELLVKNKASGINAARDEYISIWHMPSNEHCMLYTIDCFDYRNLSNATGKHNEPLGYSYLEYSEKDKKWLSGSVCEKCNIDWKWLNEEFGLAKCVSDHCDVALLHKFFTILFGGNLYDDVSLRSGLSGVVFRKLTSEDYDLIRKRERGRYVNEALKNGNVPEKFRWIKDKQYKWVLDKRGNLERCKEDKPISVVYVDSESEAWIKKGIMEFQRLMGEAATDRMLL
ncbi:MAG: hypothetical protein Q4C91_22585 [Eubacteriales bacterium]|nr:hypothetical protein [Eubacteriales bacterium]